MLKDSGKRREFGTGSVRDIADGKGRADLLPLDVIGGYTGDTILLEINDYIRKGKRTSLWRAIELFCNVESLNIYEMLLEVSKQYEDGAAKYGERNWELGQPLHVYIDSGVRHYLQYLGGYADEPHDRAFVWNMLGALWTHENLPELIDLPFADKENE